MGNIDFKKIVVTDFTSLEDLVKLGTDGTTKRQKTGEKTTEKRVSGRKRPQKPIIQNPEEEFYDDEETAYYGKLDDTTKTIVAQLERTIREMNKEDVPLRFKILLSQIDEKIKAVAIKKLRYLYDMEESCTEYYKITNWIEALCKLPIGKYKALPINKQSSVGDIRNFIKSTKEKLDATVYGHQDAKDQIIRLLAQWISNPESKGMVIGIHGAPGIGKTKLAKEGISKALGLPFSFLALGGASDGAYLDGHSYTYEGSTWGKIVDILMKAEYMNPVLYFDELDKVSLTYKGEEIINILIHITDSTQNDKYNDKYFVDVDFDLSRCLIIFSYNEEDVINPILKDRMIKIKVEGYKMKDKVAIAEKFLIPELLEQFNMHPGMIEVKAEMIEYIINNKVPEEEGVRNLRRGLESIISNLNLNMLLAEENIPMPIVVDEKVIDLYVKMPTDKSLDKVRSMYC